MGVGNSMPKFSAKKFKKERNTDIEKKDESKDAAKDAGPGDDGKKELNKWKGFMKGMIALPEAKNKIKDVELAEKVKK